MNFSAVFPTKLDSICGACTWAGGKVGVQEHPVNTACSYAQHANLDDQAVNINLTLSSLAKLLA